MKNYFLLYHNEVKQGQEGLSFYYSDVKQRLYLRHARFRKGSVSALVSSKHSKEKLKTLLAKPKDLWIFHCCGFQVLDFYFNRWKMQDVKGSHYQYSNDKKDWKDYNIGDDEKIDKLFDVSIIAGILPLGLIFRKSGFFCSPSERFTRIAL